MSGKNEFGEYPKILKIEDDGKIIALDKTGHINTDLNTHTITDDEQLKVFGQILYNPYSRQEKNRDDYYNDTNGQHRPEDFYNQRDREREWQLQEANKKSSSKNKILGFLLAIAVIVIAIVAFMAYNNHKQEENQQQVNNQQSANSQQLQQDLDNTKSQLKDSQQNEQQTQQKINSLQDRVNNLQSSNDKEEQDKASEYQNGINQLQKAQNSKENGDKEGMKEHIENMDKYIDKDKISSESKSAWENLKSWWNEHF